jgi:hypothetical protein
MTLMFDFEISLFILSVWMTITCYFNCSHVKHVYYFISYFDCSEYTEYKVKIQKESEDKDMRRGMSTSIDTLSIMFQEKNKENKKMSINVEQNTKKNVNYFPHWCGPALMARGCFGALRLAAARPTHDIESQKQANRQEMGAMETEAIIGKAPGLGIHTPKCHAAVRPCGNFSARNMLETQFHQVR